MPENISISCDKSKLDLKVIHTFLTNSYWAKGISIDSVKKCIENSLCFGVYDLEEMVGFARVVTDYCKFAYLMDVFIIESYRNKGLSLRLLDEIFSHTDLKDVKNWMLATRDAHDLYKKYGFTSIDDPVKYMVRKR